MKLLLPQSVRVSISRGKSGAYLAHLPEYDVFTEADGLMSLEYQINDLICTYFDVPKELQDAIWYRKKEVEEEVKPNQSLIFSALTAPSNPFCLQQ